MAGMGLSERVKMVLNRENQERLKYIEECRDYIRLLRGEMYETKPNSDAWRSLKQEIRANIEEIEIMEKLIETTSAATEVESIERVF